MEGAHTNIELKARDHDPGSSRETCEAIGAAPHGTLDQRDTYFRAPNGRLKLREEGQAAELIAYERPDRAEARESHYRIVAVERPEALRALLDAALGVVAEVSKRRQLFLWEGVRIHLDEVDGLGHFIELEVVAAPGSDLVEERAKAEWLKRRIGVADADLVGVGYVDLLSGGLFGSG